MKLLMKIWKALLRWWQVLTRSNTSMTKPSTNSLTPSEREPQEPCSTSEGEPERASGTSQSSSNHRSQDLTETDEEDMQAEFYDVKIRKKVTRPVTSKTVYHGKSGERYAVRGKTESGRNLTKFVSKELFDSCQAPVV